MVYKFDDTRLYVEMLIDALEKGEVTMSLTEKHLKLLMELSQTFTDKNTDYGNSFEESLDSRGLIAAVVRMEDKFKRFDNLSQEDDIFVKDEPLRDTLMDLANYAIMTVMWLEKTTEVYTLGELIGKETIDDMKKEMRLYSERMKRLKGEIDEEEDMDKKLPISNVDIFNDTWDVVNTFIGHGETGEEEDMDKIYKLNEEAKSTHWLEEEFYDAHMNSQEISENPVQLEIWETPENIEKIERENERLRKKHLDYQHGKALYLNEKFDEDVKKRASWARPWRELGKK